MMILKVKQDVQEQEMTKVELFEIIRREHFLHGNGIRKISRERGIHRRMVRQALDNAIPPNRKNVEREAPVLRTAHKQLVDKWLEADKTAPRKQRHTARRIWQRLRAETDFTGAESTIRRFVGRRRRELGLSRERDRARERAWNKLRTLLGYQVVSAEDKASWTAAFLEAYGVLPELNRLSCDFVENHSTSSKVIRYTQCPVFIIFCRI